MNASRTWVKIARIWIFIMWLLPVPFVLGLMYRYGPLPVLIQVLWSAVILPQLVFVPKVVLTDEGIYVYALRKNKIWRWNQIIQAGILWRLGRGLWYNDLVLLRDGGSPRGYKDKAFLVRNAGKTIHLAATEEVRSYVIQHYGPLDFDLSDGRKEQSVIVD